MFCIEDNVIYITQGDDASFSVTITGDDGSSYTPEANDVLRMTVKKRASMDSEELIEIVASGSTFTIRHEDTRDLPVGKYSADIQLTTADGTRHTIWPGLEGAKRFKEHNFENFIIMPEVTEQ